MIRNAAIVFICVSLVAGLSLPSISQTSTELEDYFKNSVGLSNDQIADIRRGKAVGKVLKSRTPAEIFVFGAVYIKATPEGYVQFASDSTDLGNSRSSSLLGTSVTHRSWPTLRVSISTTMTQSR
jgi:hypothetical protein